MCQRRLYHIFSFHVLKTPSNLFALCLVSFFALAFWAVSNTYEWNFRRIRRSTVRTLRAPLPTSSFPPISQCPQMRISPKIFCIEARYLPVVAFYFLHGERPRSQGLLEGGGSSESVYAKKPFCRPPARQKPRPNKGQRSDAPGGSVHKIRRREKNQQWFRLAKFIFFQPDFFPIAGHSSRDKLGKNYMKEHCSF